MLCRESGGGRHYFAGSSGGSSGTPGIHGRERRRGARGRPCRRRPTDFGSHSKAHQTAPPHAPTEQHHTNTAKVSKQGGKLEQTGPVQEARKKSNEAAAIAQGHSLQQAQATDSKGEKNSSRQAERSPANSVNVHAPTSREGTRQRQQESQQHPPPRSCSGSTKFLASIDEHGFQVVGPAYWWRKREQL